MQRSPGRAVLRMPLRLVLLVAASLAAPGSIPALTITEIFYDPPGAPLEKGKLKFIEIFNDTATAVDLTGYRFAEGVDYVFPPGTLLGGRKYLAICADQEAIQARYGIQNALGDFTGNLDEDGDELVILDEGGGLAARVDFRDRGKWTSVPAAGTGYTLCLRDPYLDPERPESWTRSGLPWGTPGGENFPPPYVKETEIFGESAVWKYRKGWDGTAMAAFSDPPAAWQGPGFDDGGWSEGPAGIGFGDAADDRTVLEDMKGNYLAVAVRKRFEVSRALLDEMESAVLKLRFDDGYVAYLNGEEVGRLNVGTDVQVSFDKAATSTREVTSAATLIQIPKEKLREGENVLAIQVHNRLLTDADAGVVPSLLWKETVVPGGGPASGLRLSEVLREPVSGGERWLELYNASDSVLDLGGFAVTDDPSRRDRYVFPAGRKMAARGFLVLPEPELGIPLGGSGQRRELKLFLFEADGVSVPDAAILELNPGAVASPLSQARIPEDGGVWYASTVPTREGPNEAPLERGVVLNEVMYHPLLGPETGLPDGRTLEGGEYVEVYNRSDRAVDLGGWTFTKGYNYMFPAGTVLGSGEYLVVAPDPEYIRSTYKLPAEKVLGPEATPEARAAFGVLSNSGETIRLEDLLGNPVQEVIYADGGEWDGLADGGGSSLELIDPWQDNTYPSAWGGSDETSRAPWKQYTYTGTYPSSGESEIWLLLVDDGECLIDEVSVKKGDAEHVPNGGFESATTSPWRIDGNHVRSKKTTAEAHAGQACLHLAATGGGDNRVNRVEVDTNPRMSGAVTVSFWARWLQGCRRLQTSGYNNNSLAANHLLEVPPDLGTPGRENSRRAKLRAETGSDDLGPAIRDVTHSPAVPKAGEAVTVLARISDPDGVKGAQVEYRLGRKTAAAKTADLFDDGQHGDGESGDGLYGGTIPAQSLNAKVLFDIVATDSGDRVRRFPADAPERTLLYQVNAPITSPVFRYRLILDDDNLSRLQTRKLHSDELVDGAFVFEESKAYYNVGARYHGSPWNRPPDPKMFRIEFPRDRKLLGQSKINIIRYGNVPNEGTAFQLIRRATGGEDARTPITPRFNYIKYLYNGVSIASTSAMSESIPPGSDYFRLAFPNDADGYAYKITGKLEFDDAGNFTNAVVWTQFRYYGPTKESYRYFYNPSTNSVDDNFDPLIRFLTLMDPSKTPLTKFEDPKEGIESILNVENFLRVLAIRVLHDDWDTIGIANGQNAYVYYAPVEGKFYLLPFDMDHTFADTNARLTPSELNVDPGVSRMLNNSAKYRRTYLRILKEVTTSFWTAAAMSPWLDQVALETRGLVGAPSGIKSFMTSRLSVLKSRLPQLSANIKFAITLPAGGKAFAVKASEATIGGTAPLEIVTFLISRSGGDPEEVYPSWLGTMGTDWRLKLPLQRDKNTFRIFGFSSKGSIVGDILSIDIYDATGWAAPSIGSIAPAAGPLEGGTAVEIRGEGFQEVLDVRFGTAPAAGIERVSAALVRAIAPAAKAPGAVDVRVANLDGQAASVSGGFTYLSPEPTFIRGDFDGNGILDLADPINCLDYLFHAGAIGCADAADTDDSGILDLTDPIYLLEHLYQGGPQPPLPFPAAGPDPTPDSLDCLKSRPGG